MIKFRQKDFSLGKVVSWTAAGGSTGLTIGSLLGKAIYGKKDPKKSSRIALSGLAIGAALGAVASGISEGRTAFNRKTTVDARLMSTIVSNLKKAGLEEGVHFTRDPKVASELRTKVCICISKISGDLRIVINTVSDRKIRDLAIGMTKNIPNKSAVSENVSDRFNDITITTISDSTMDAGLVTGIAERFIHSGYPVQLVEVG